MRSIALAAAAFLLAAPAFAQSGPTEPSPQAASTPAPTPTATTETAVETVTPPVRSSTKSGYSGCSWSTAQTS